MQPTEVDEFAAPLRFGRTFALEYRPLLGDCAPSGRIRLDALARWLQDIAYADVADAGVAEQAIWVLRRVRMQVGRFPRLGEPHRVLTYCSGVGRMWAERRTTITPLDDAAGRRAGGGAQPPVVETAALWIHLDPERRVPSPLSPAEMSLFGSAAGSRQIHHRLRHPALGDAPELAAWTFRETDCDVADHVNNAAYWEPLEQELLARERRTGESLLEFDGEIEYRLPAQPGEYAIHGVDDTSRWIVEREAGEPYASIVVLNGRTESP